MAYCHKSNTSDVRVYHSGSDLYVCYQCLLVDDNDSNLSPYNKFKDARQLSIHLEYHKAAGHKVLDSVIDLLELEYLKIRRGIGFRGMYNSRDLGGV